ncbi:MAG: DUF5615 family PIN-like protein [Caldilineaceae bacterium]
MVPLHFLLDENLSPETVRRLQEEGYQAVWLTEFVPLGSSDAEIARAALDAGAVIVTQDLDFAEAFLLWKKQDSECGSSSKL